jgi:hypothetical protein
MVKEEFKYADSGMKILSLYFDETQNSYEIQKEIELMIDKYKITKDNVYKYREFGKPEDKEFVVTFLFE